jgi:hypothetical protein
MIRDLTSSYEDVLTINKVFQMDSKGKELKVEVVHSNRRSEVYEGNNLLGCD